MRNPTSTQEAMEILGCVDQEVASRLNPLIDLLLSTPDNLPYPGFPLVDGIWVTSEGKQLMTLTGFVGYLDCETTGLTQHDRVTAAVGIGYLDGAATVVRIVFNTPSLLPVSGSVIANWNQPYDRQYYLAPDDNSHIDLMGLCLAVRGKPEKAEWKLPHLQTWERYCHRGLSLKEVLWDRLGEDLDKGVREDIIQGLATPTDILEYCYRDTCATVKVGKLVLSEYLQQTPSRVSLMGHIMRHSFRIPISGRWEGYYDRVEEWYAGQTAYKNSQVQELIWDSLIPLCPQHESLHTNYPERYRPSYLNGWLKFLGKVEWTKGNKIKPPKVKQPKLGVQIQLQLLPLAYLVSQDWVTLFLPKYLWELLGKDFHPATRAFSLVIPLEWLGAPITYDRKAKEWIAGGVTLANIADEKKSLSTPLSKEYLKLLDEGLTSSNVDQTFVSAIKNTIRWGMFRDRVRDLEVRDGWLTPLYSPTGTLSQRAADKVFLLFGSPKTDQGGTELMSMIEAKPGYDIVTADLDAAELVLAGLVASEVSGCIVEDAHPFSRANLLGSKSEGTDTHSIIARQIGISRDGAKTRVYAGVYGEGLNARTLGIRRQTGCDQEEATRLAKDFTNSFVHGLAKDFFEGVKKLSDTHAPTRLLSRELPLAYQYSEGDLVTSIRNHHIQSLGVDWLDTIQVITMLMCESESVDATLVLTRHDELIYHVLSEHADRFEEIIQTAHKIAKFCICHQFGITTPNDTWAKFSEVDRSVRYRKSRDAVISTVTTKFD